MANSRVEQVESICAHAQINLEQLASEEKIDMLVKRTLRRHKRKQMRASHATQPLVFMTDMTKQSEKGGVFNE